MAREGMTRSMADQQKIPFTVAWEMTRFGVKMEPTPCGETIQVTRSPVETTQSKGIKEQTAFMAAQAMIRSQEGMDRPISFMAEMAMI